MQSCQLHQPCPLAGVGAKKVGEAEEITEVYFTRAVEIEGRVPAGIGSGRTKVVGEGEEIAEVDDAVAAEIAGNGCSDVVLPPLFDTRRTTL